MKVILQYAFDLVVLVLLSTVLQDLIKFFVTNFVYCVIPAK